MKYLPSLQEMVSHFQGSIDNAIKNGDIQKAMILTESLHSFLKSEHIDQISKDSPSVKSEKQ